MTVVWFYYFISHVPFPEYIDTHQVTSAFTICVFLLLLEKCVPKNKSQSRFQKASLKAIVSTTDECHFYTLQLCIQFVYISAIWIPIITQDPKITQNLKVVGNILFCIRCSHIVKMACFYQTILLTAICLLFFRVS